ncbi:Asp-tRNA(Asn)/Glu-tRNA(Gln) amidotransferase subunit GatA [Borrelia sp. HM]|uniref:Asp-tRNA(Asn)/Glu-tRNA(Gln) amidotransferase subunit GatA n=1 Tax=Borrelia sp. HM TaxID=1882662 RepID=UPI001C74C996|nr:Asp-tRNA(Asn)/Glu-tRNA(Gln) amidotransferase subunit GatA [Borrelia sp. HM]BCR21776.1 Glutamyl-tRNA(Gln) amidotransferase subunit A [Borrelia sp. HM]
MDLRGLSLVKIKELILTRKCKIYDVVTFYKELYEANKDVNGYIEFFDDALKLAKEYDGLLDRGQGQCLPLIGLPIAVKDNIAIKDKSLTCASEILQGYISPYDATVIKRLKDKGAILIGRTNMDEFAMGSSCEFSYYGVTFNPLNKEYVVGGSSGGSGAVVADNQAPFALGSDTGGSVRIPASFANLIGFKPSYGGLSRYGLVSYASSLDQIGFFSNSIDDVALILSFACGIDRMDATSIDIFKSPYPLLNNSLTGIKVAVIKELDENLMEPEVAHAFSKFKSKLLGRGIEIHEVSIEEINFVLSLYYSVSPVEAASNLARYTCIHYGKRLNDDLNLDDFYHNHRSLFLQEEVRRRIVLGNYLLSEGYDLKYYSRACKIIENLLIPKFNEIFNNFAYIVTPTSLVKPFKIGENFDEPVKMYYSDLCTVIANLIGSPALSVPFAKDDKGLPIGMQIIGQFKKDFELLNFAKNIIEGMD